MYNIKVTFSAYSKILGRNFVIVESHRNIDDARLRACALGWVIVNVEDLH